MNDDHKPTLHIVFGMSAASSIRQALGQIGRRERVIGLPDDLSFGPINPPEPSLREKWVEDVLGCEHSEVVQLAELFWAAATSDAVCPVAWVCRNHAAENAGFLEYIDRVDGAPFELIDATDLTAPHSRSPTANLWSLGLLDPSQIIQAGLIDRKVPVQPADLDGFRTEWAQLKAENAPLRIVVDTRLRSAPITYFDDAIVACGTSEWQKGVRIVGEAMGTLFDGSIGQSPGDMVIWARVIALARSGIFEIDGAGPDTRGYRVRLRPTA